LSVRCADLQVLLGRTTRADGSDDRRTADGSPRSRACRARAALHHDSHEAFACDLPTPVKKLLAASNGVNPYDELCSRLDRAIQASLGITLYPKESKEGRLIKDADVLAILSEARELLPDKGARIRDALSGTRTLPGEDELCELAPAMTPGEARAAFLAADARPTVRVPS